MRANLDITHGLVFAEAVQMELAPRIGRDTAHSLIAGACRRAALQGRHLRDILLDEPETSKLLDAPTLDRLFDPLGYLGETRAFIERTLANHAPGGATR
jgi:3-carboxy-cis,cis-muconate cycloisomerase